MDRKKYVFEASDDVKKVMAMGVTRGGAIWTDTMDVENFEELNSDYINKHFGDLQDTAYQRGLNDAWEAARKVAFNSDDGGLSIDELDEIFGCYSLQGVFRAYSAQQTIAKLKAYEEKQKADDEIKVGDVVDWSGDKFIVTRIFKPYNNAEECDGVGMDGCTYHDVLISGLTKTGRHVDITDMLKGALE